MLDGVGFLLGFRMLVGSCFVFPRGQCHFCGIPSPAEVAERWFNVGPALSKRQDGQNVDFLAIRMPLPEPRPALRDV